MSFAQELMNAAAPVWEKYMTHPFITEMIDGTLEKKKFAFYLMQDAQYLKDYEHPFFVGLPYYSIWNRLKQENSSAAKRSTIYQPLSRAKRMIVSAHFSRPKDASTHSS